MQPYPDIDCAGATHQGLVRAHNEDSFLSRPDLGVWAVADGMGGHEAGEIASAMIVAALDGLPGGGLADLPGLLGQVHGALAGVNQQIRQVGHSQGGIVIGAAVAVALLRDRYFAYLWAGDSRVYLVRAGSIFQLTRDHTEVEQMLREGLISVAEAEAWPRKNVITRAIGVFDDPEIDMKQGELRAGDTLVLCSDGLTAHVLPREIAERADQPAAKICADLIDLTLERGATDNVTAVVIRFRPGQPREETTRHPFGPPGGAP